MYTGGDFDDGGKFTLEKRPSSFPFAIFLFEGSGSLCSRRPSFTVENRETVLRYLGSASVGFVAAGANRLRTPDPPRGFWRAGKISVTLLFDVSP